jgi:hypothetical protein
VDWETVFSRIEFNKAVHGASKARKEFGMKREVILQVSVNYAEALRTAGRKPKVLGLRTEQRDLATSARPSEGATTNSTTQVHDIVSSQTRPNTREADRSAGGPHYRRPSPCSSSSYSWYRLLDDERWFRKMQEV